MVIVGREHMERVKPKFRKPSRCYMCGGTWILSDFKNRHGFKCGLCGAKL